MNNKGENIDKASSSTSSIIWDCGSPLYDSYELVSLVHLIERNTMILPVKESEPEIDVVKMRRCYSSKEGEKINSDGNKVRKLKRGFYSFCYSIIGDLINKNDKV
ncbi:hypothetical protein R3W88_021833 [Solanum pinnatisectum]|uniref:Uncharacterized protein n=1 Tax=Solanum pinnatisectum TaxID=50273 RepID=A0AAV9LSW2_9SOLN|nr:hypothetical protein R3W88_021833 [Solanum pinnatisectum]